MVTVDGEWPGIVRSICCINSVWLHLIKTKAKPTPYHKRGWAVFRKKIQQQNQIKPKPKLVNLLDLIEKLSYTKGIFWSRSLCKSGVISEVTCFANNVFSQYLNIFLYWVHVYFILSSLDLDIVYTPTISVCFTLLLS